MFILSIIDNTVQQKFAFLMAIYPSYADFCADFNGAISFFTIDQEKNLLNIFDFYHFGHFYKKWASIGT